MVGPLLFLQRHAHTHTHSTYKLPTLSRRTALLRKNKHALRQDKQSCRGAEWGEVVGERKREGARPKTVSNNKQLLQFHLTFNIIFCPTVDHICISYAVLACLSWRCAGYSGIKCVNCLQKWKQLFEEKYLGGM